MNIYLEYLGTYNARTQHKQIIWCIESLHKMKSKRAKTKYLLDIHEQYFNVLYEKECFELLQYLQDKLTEKQIKNRYKWRLKQQVQHIEFMENLEVMMRKIELRKQLFTINLN